MKKRTRGSTWKRSLGLAVALLCAWGSYASAAVDPAYADKYVQVQNQMEQRVSNQERQAAADSLKQWRADVAAAKLLYKKKPATSTSGPVKGIAGIDYDTVPTGPGELLLNGQPKPPDYFTTANWAYSPPLAKFVDTLAGVGPGGANTLTNYISIAVPDKLSYPGSDYYEIDLVQFSQKMHRDLPPTRLRGYVQANLAADGSICGGKTGITCPTHNAPEDYYEKPRYLGATIVAQRNVPVRIKFTNKLGTGTAGDLFIPVDQSVMGAGEGPLTPAGDDCDPELEACANYTQNRATIHLHGGRTPWISDGTPHQWITPASETTPYPQGVSVANVPDMEDPGNGSMTFYYSNQQTARLMFYHDHAFGITRLNVYAGEAAGYLVQDDYEAELVTSGVLPDDIFPLVIQDKTFVDASEIRKYDPLWNYGSGAQTGVGADGKKIYAPQEGDLWMPHVYMPAQFPENPDLTGVNPFGRWMYGPWFYPPTVIKHPPVANPYFDPDCNSPNPYVLADCQTPGQNSLMPATPHPSMGMEAFADTAVVNGTVFPALEVEPRAYRFRILNAANDRGFNLSFYKADTSVTSPADTALSPYTEVKMVDAAPTAGWPELWPTDGRVEGVPDPGTFNPTTGRWSNWGPSFIQIGTDAGFLPKPAIRNPQPVTWITDPTAFWVGVVRETGLGLMPAERADVIVDFCDYAGQTLILYNDAPAAWPAGVWNYDYYTGAPDRRDSGGYGAGGTFNPVTGVYDGGIGILPGYGPNTRTVMQVKVKAGACTPYDIDALNNEFLTRNNDSGATLFERAMEPIIVGQDYYNEVYPDSSFPSAAPWRGIRNALTERTLKFVTVDGDHVEIPLQPKGIHDEMGASFDPEYGRMSGNLAIELEPPTTNNANLNLYGFSDIPTEIVANSEGAKINIDSLGQLADGTQIWNVSHNGVDTHPIHFHIFDVQLVSRIGWDGQIALPEPNEYGWKDTVRISPLMDTIVAVRPVAPLLPFGITDSIRPLNPAIPIGSGMGFNSVDPVTGQIRATGLVTNVMYNFGWEYVWHCHILSHEEMDMMRPIVLQYAALAADAFSIASNTANVPSGRNLVWNDPTPVDYTNLPSYIDGTPGSYGDATNEVGFNIWRSASGTGPFVKAGAALANQTTFSDIDGGALDTYVIEALSAGGSTFTSALSTVTLNATGPFAAPATVSLAATIGAPFGQQVDKVEFYNGVILLGSDSTAGDGFTFAWAGVQQGSYNVTAKAIDTLTGLFAYSDITPVTVTSGLTADFTGTAFGACDSVVLTNTSFGDTIASSSWLINGVTYPTLDVTLASLPAGRTIGSLTGTYPVTLTVTGLTGEVATVTKNVVISNTAPTADAGGPYTFDGSGLAALTGTAGDLVDTCNTLTYAWDIDNNGAYDYFTLNRTIKHSVVYPWLGIGDHTITFKVTDSSGAVATDTTTLTVAAPVLTINPATLPVGSVNAAYSSNALGTSGGVAPYTWSATGLPIGLSINTSTGAISGSTADVLPSALFTVFPVSITVQDSTLATATAVLNLRINQVIPAAPTSLNASAVSTTQVNLTWTDNANNEDSGILQRATNSNFTAGQTAWIIAADQVSYTDSTVVAATTYYYRVLSKNIAGSSVVSNTAQVTTPAIPLAVTTTTLVTGSVNAPYTATAAAIGGIPPYNWSATGLPSGLDIAANGDISGVPNNLLVIANFTTFTVTLTVTDSTLTTANSVVNLRINQVIPTAPSGLNANAVSSAQVNLTWSDNANNEENGTLQRATNSTFTTGLVSRTISMNQTAYTDSTVSGSTTYFYRVRVRNIAGNSAYSSTVQVTTPVAPLSVTTTALATGSVNAPYSRTVAASGGTGPYSWSATGLPSGLDIAANGVISGTPNNLLVVANFTIFPVTLTVMDSTLATASRIVNLRINQVAPAAPSDLSANAVSSTQVDLTWVDNANNEENGILQRARDINFTVALTNQTTAIDQTSFTDTTVVAGTTYFYRIRYRNIAGYTAYTATAQATTP